MARLQEELRLIEEEQNEITASLIKAPSNLLQNQLSKLDQKHQDKLLEKEDLVGQLLSVIG